MTMQHTGLVLEIQRMSTEDGPGLRTTVFLKGCSLACAWCHNPESISTKVQVQWVGARCIGCGACLALCPQGALSRSDRGVDIDRAACTGCGRCVEQCPGAALEALGKTWDVDALVAELLKDRAYFEKSDHGGVTASGGEALLHAPFVAAVFRKLKARGIHTALDTCGQVSWQAMEAVLPLTDLVLYDLKLLDPQAHERFTGHHNRRVLDNLVRLAGRMGTELFPKELWIRTPIIPGATDAVGNIKEIGTFIATELGAKVARWELLAFNRLCADKYARLGREFPFKDCGLIAPAHMDALLKTAIAAGVSPAVVRATGALAKA